MELIFLFFLLPAFIYWCVNEKAGLQIGIIVLLCIFVILQLEYLNFKFLAGFDYKWIVISVICCVYLLLRKKIEALLVKGGFRACLITTASASFLLILYLPSYEFAFPAGALLGLGIGYCLNKHYLGFKSADCLQRKGVLKYLTLLARFVLGTAVLVLIVFRVESFILIISESQNIMLYSFLYNSLLSFWISIAAPWVFIKLRLVGISNDE